MIRVLDGQLAVQSIMDSKWMGRLRAMVQTFVAEAKKLAMEIRGAIERIDSLDAILAECPWSAVVKSSDFHVLVANRAYDQLFGQGKPTLGDATTTICPDLCGRWLGTRMNRFLRAVL